MTQVGAFQKPLSQAEIVARLAGSSLSVATLTATTGVVAPQVQASSSAGLLLKSSNGTTVATFGAGPGTGTTLAGGLVTTGTIAVNDTTDASSTTTGSLQTDGGLGVAKAAHIGTTLTVGGNCSIDGSLNLGPNTELTIAAGAVTKTGSYHKIDTESDAASDDLDTISGGADGDILTIRTTVNTRDVVVKHATGNIHLDGDADFTLSTRLCTLTLRYDGDASGWVEIGRATITT